MLDLVKAADYFQIAGLKEMCGRLLAATVVPENCLSLLNTACKYDVKNLKTQCNEFFVKNKEQVMKKTPNLGEVVTDIPPLGLEFMGLKLKDDKP